MFNILGSYCTDRWGVSDRSQCNSRSWCGHWRRRVYKAFHSPAWCCHQVSCVDKLMHHWLELSRWSVGECYYMSSVC